MIEIGRVCVKTAGRDSGMKCIVIDILDDDYAMIDGQTRRKKCNVDHLEALKDVVKISKNADHKEVVKELKKLGIEVKEKVKKEKKESTAKKPAKSKKKASPSKK